MTGVDVQNVSNEEIRERDSVQFESTKEASIIYHVQLKGNG